MESSRQFERWSGFDAPKGMAVSNASPVKDSPWRARTWRSPQNGDLEIAAR